MAAVAVWLAVSFVWWVFPFQFMQAIEGGAALAMPLTAGTIAAFYVWRMRPREAFHALGRGVLAYIGFAAALMFALQYVGNAYFWFPGAFPLAAAACLALAAVVAVSVWRSTARANQGLIKSVFGSGLIFGSMVFLAAVLTGQIIMSGPDMGCTPVFLSNVAGAAAFLLGGLWGAMRWRRGRTA